MFKSLEKKRFGISFIKWVHIVYTNIKGCVKNNNWVSGTYNLFRGIRQGCPLSCLTFVIVVDLLSTKLRTKTNLEGFSVDRRYNVIP